MPARSGVWVPSSPRMSSEVSRAAPCRSIKVVSARRDDTGEAGRDAHGEEDADVVDDDEEDAGGDGGGDGGADAHGEAGGDGGGDGGADAHGEAGGDGGGDGGAGADGERKMREIAASRFTSNVRALESSSLSSSSSSSLESLPTSIPSTSDHS